jgi:hypothetical protein
MMRVAQLRRSLQSSCHDLMDWTSSIEFGAFGMDWRRGGATSDMSDDALPADDGCVTRMS